MKKFLLPLFLSVVALGVSAAGFHKTMAAKTNVAPLADEVADVQELKMKCSILALHDDVNYLTPNFYIILSDNEATRYDNNTGEITAPAYSFSLVLDLFNHTPEDGVYLPAGTYTMLVDDNSERPLGFTHEYSMLNFYDYDGTQMSIQLENPIDVVRDEDGTYHISTLVSYEETLMRVTFDGPIVVGSATEKPTVYPQLKRNVTADLNKGGISYYQGVTDYSNCGVSMLNLYDVEFDEDGVMAGEGYNLCMLIAHKRYRKPDYKLTPETYVNAMNLDRETWYPAREVNYYGATYPFGSYLREMKIVNGQRSYTYAYLKEGTFIIEENGDGTYKGTLKATTSLGYTVDLTWSGNVALDVSNASVPAGVSDLKDDVVMDFSPLEKGRIYHSGTQGGCRTLIVDLGSPSGKDEAINYGGDLLRMEFLVATDQVRLASGIYYVVPRRWNSDELKAGGTYEPGSLNKGYFDGNGAQIGTRYAHFEDNRYCVYDMVGPAEQGYVIVETDDYVNYTFDINLMDDQDFKMEGVWENKPLEYFYNPEAIEIDPGLSAIGAIDADNNAVKVAVIGSELVICNAGDATVALYDIDGRLVRSVKGQKTIAVGDLAKGIYIVKVDDSTVKVAL